MLLQKGERIVFIGDSVTDFGRKQPYGEGLNGVGTGYVSLIHSFLNAYYPDYNIRVTNMGISGNTILDLKARWQSDVIDLKPDYVNIMIGINDVWRQFDEPDVIDDHVYPDVYEATYRELLDRTIPCVKGVLLMTPFYIEDSTADMMRRRMDEYGAIVHRLADEYKLPCLDLQEIFNRYLKFRHSSFVTWDRVHPNQSGALLIAAAFLRQIGFDRPIF